MAAEPATHEMAHEDFRRDLGNGLVLRWSAPEDVEAVAALYAQVFRRSADAPPGWIVPVWARDMFSGRHPHIGPRDFAIVEDTRSGSIIASTCLLRYSCEYEGMPFGFGQPEIVATLPEHRRQGLIRAIFELIHAKSDGQGDLVQGITGIPYYYRQFGYEYAATLDEGDLTVYFPAIAPLKPDTAEPYVLREATPDDIPLLRRLWAREHAHAGLWTAIEDDYWRWAMVGTHPDALQRWRVYVIEEAAGRQAGALVLSPGRWGTAVRANAPMVDAGVPLVRVMPSVLRGLQALAETTQPARPDIPAAGAIAFRYSGPALRDALHGTPFAAAPYSYAWYLRVADLPRFLRYVTPVLERRLAASAHSGYTGELTVDFYRGGLRLAFEDGKLTGIEDSKPSVSDEALAGFPPLVFLQALFGFRNLHELRTIYPDVWAEGDATALLEALFPKRPSLLLPLD